MSENELKLTEFGYIPSKWDLLQVKQLSKVVTGNTPPTHEEKYFNGNIPWVTPTDISNSKYISKTNRTLSIEGIKKAKGIPADSVLVTCIASIGKNAVLKKFGSCNQQINAIVPSRLFNSDYLYYYFEGNKRRLQNLSGSTAVPIISKSRFESFKVLLPPLPEQQKIAEILSTVDEKIEVIEAQINQTTALKKGLMQQLLTKGIGHTKFKDSPLGKIPESWEVVKLEDVIEKIVGGGTPSRDNLSCWNGNIPWATVKDLKKTIIDETEEYITNEGLKNSASNLIPKNTLVIATRMALGKAVFFTKDVAINQDLKAVFPKDNTFSKFLFYWFLNSADLLQSIGSGSTVKGLRLEQLKSLNFLLPHINEQKKISNILLSIDEKLNNLECKRKGFISFKKGLMQQLLTGKLRVNFDNTLIVKN